MNDEQYRSKSSHTSSSVNINNLTLTAPLLTAGSEDAA
jgi:hypothetical protein